MPTLPLAGRVALVSGANHGIGAATAAALAARGADVAVTYLAYTPDDDPDRPDAYRVAREQGAEATVAAVEAHGRRCRALPGDLSDPEVPARLFDAAEAGLGPVSILVNNASGWRKDSIIAGAHDAVGRRTERVTAASVDAQMLVDARGGALMMAELAARVAARPPGERGGRIVSLTSGGPAGFPGEASYGAAKAALENYTMTAASELAHLGVTANIVYPPVTDTGWVTDAVREFVAGSPNHVHVAAPEEVAEVIAWLCTDAARLVTGTLVRLR